MRSRPFRPRGLPIYVASVPAAPFSSLPSRLYLLCRSSRRSIQHFLGSSRLAKAAAFSFSAFRSLTPQQLEKNMSKLIRHTQKRGTALFVALSLTALTFAKLGFLRR